MLNWAVRRIFRTAFSGAAIGGGSFCARKEGLPMNNAYVVNLLQRTLDSPASSSPTTAASAPSGSSFAAIMEQSMARVNDLQQEADRMTQRLALGDVDDISDVVIATSQAELALRMMVEVRNKLVDAYQQISRMPV